MAGSKKKAVVTPKKPKKKRERKVAENPVEQKIVTVTLDDHEYTGYLKYPIFWSWWLNLWRFIMERDMVAWYFMANGKRHGF